MESNTPNSLPSVTSRPSHRGAGWWRAMPLLLVLIGAVIVTYPLWPGIRFALTKPEPVLPYHTKLSADSPVWQSLPSLPSIGNRSTPSDNRLVIPSIGVDMPILEGPTQKTLDRGGIWHIPNTSNPARGGNMVLSGHRWQYLPPSSTTLYLLDKVKNDQPVIVYWHGQEYDYIISGREIVNPNRVDILNNTPDPRLTIFTCTPLFSTKQRLVLYGQLIS